MLKLVQQERHRRGTLIVAEKTRTIYHALLPSMQTAKRHFRPFCDPAVEFTQTDVDEYFSTNHEARRSIRALGIKPTCAVMRDLCDGQPSDFLLKQLAKRCGVSTEVVRRFVRSREHRGPS